MSKDDYIIISCVFKTFIAKAVLIEEGFEKHWIPRSCIHGADDSKLSTHDDGDEVELRIMEWLAEERGLI